MNTTYFRFTFINTIKKRPVWITWLLFLLTTACFIIILPAVARANPLQAWANTAMPICQSFIGMTVALFTSVLAIHIFKDSNEEGTELIVISKPLSRWSIVLTKFFVFAFFCFLVNLTCCALTAFTWFLPKLETKFYWQLIVSMFIGNVVSFGVFGGIAILLSIPFAKAGIIVTNVMLSLVFIIFQVLSLFVFSVPSKSLVDHGMGATSYILADRDMTTGKYTEKNIVKLDTHNSNNEAKVKNKAIDWKGTKEYWEDQILKNNPTPILNVFDVAGQIGLSYLSVGIDDYSLRQAVRNFALSRFYNYTLNSPASPEIISGVEDKQSISWFYRGIDGETVPDLITGDVVDLYTPETVAMVGIPPTLNRLRGFADKLPIGYLKDAEHPLLSEDVFFEAEQFAKYKPAFEIMYKTLYDWSHYDEVLWEDGDEYLRTTTWKATTKNTAHYYDLVWACFTGHTTDEQYLGEDSPMKEYTQQFFDVNSVMDLNERFIQYKYYVCLRAIEDQNKLLSQPYTTDFEKEAKNNAEVVDWMKKVHNLTRTQSQDVNANWFMVDSNDKTRLTLPLVGPNTRSPDFTYATTVRSYLQDKVFTTHEERLENIPKTTNSLLTGLDEIYTKSGEQSESYLFVSLEKPDRSATKNGRVYTFDDGWTPYYRTLMALIQPSEWIPVTPTSDGHNLKWFFYSTSRDNKYWVNAVVWAVISFGMLTGGAIVYKKHDVK